ncbi:MAG: type II toxin-antitoxin system VapC family toxin, partial [Aridibacter sp.]
INSAMILADKYALRGYDAVQLAAAVEIETERKSLGASHLIFVSADNELNDAAKTEGLATENPSNY